MLDRRLVPPLRGGTPRRDSATIGKKVMTLAKILYASGRLVSDDKGVTAVEYGVLGALIIVVCITIIGTVGTNLTTAFTSISTAL